MDTSRKPSLPTGTGEQFEKFVKAAREHEADENEARWQERLKKVVKHKGEPEKPVE